MTEDQKIENRRSALGWAMDLALKDDNSVSTFAAKGSVGRSPEEIVKASQVFENYLNKGK